MYQSRSCNLAFLHTKLRMVRRDAPETSGEEHLQKRRDEIVGVVTAFAQWEGKGPSYGNKVLPGVPCAISWPSLLRLSHPHPHAFPKSPQPDAARWGAYRGAFRPRAIVRLPAAIKFVQSYENHRPGGWERIVGLRFLSHGVFSFLRACSAAISDYVSSPALIRRYRLDLFGR